VTVHLRPGESQENLLKRFRKAVAMSGIRRDVRKKRWFVSKSEQRRQAKAQAIRRLRRRRNRRQSGRGGQRRG
jgi:small subunit ribosomal protein S21